MNEKDLLHEQDASQEYQKIQKMKDIHGRVEIESLDL